MAYWMACSATPPVAPNDGGDVDPRRSSGDEFAAILEAGLVENGLGMRGEAWLEE
jgi:hypothetical protein